MSVRYKAGQSAGTPFAVLPFRQVVVTLEALDKVSEYPEELVVYTAIVKDDLGAALPTAFVADLEINSTKLIEGQAFDAAVYDPVTFELTLTFTVPIIAEGDYNVKLAWAKQTI